MGEPPSVVFDTNILFSAVLSPHGKPGQCVRLAKRNEVRSLTCWHILEEFGTKLRAKLGFSPQRARKAVEEVHRVSTLVQIDRSLRVVKDDPDDDKVLECALAGEAQYVVTGDSHLLDMKHYGRIVIVTPVDFLANVGNR